MRRQSITLFFILTCAVAVAQSPSNDPYRNEMREFSRMDSLQMPAPGMILFTGSSSIAKWKDIQDYFPGYKVLNRGFGGSQFSDLIQYAGKVIYHYKPKQVFIYEGDNDLNAGKDPQMILAQARELREMIAKNLPGVPVVFISPKPSPSRWNLREKYEIVNSGLAAYAKKTKRTKFVNVWPAMLDKEGQPLPVFLDDKLHMTADGYKIWKKVLEPYLLK